MTFRDDPPDCEPLPAGLYIVATPIGNMGDITYRAVATLKSVDLVVCEDSRVTGKLMQRYGLATPLKPYHEHNAARQRPGILRKLQDGAAVALVSDAGTPLISDPGYKLVRAAIDLGIHITHCPGACAAITGLVVSGVPSDRFLFAGFLPAKQKARLAALEILKTVPASLVFYESGNRLAASLRDMAAVFGSRPACVARELTKLYEQARRDGLSGLADYYHAGGPPKGEVVILVAPGAGPDKPALEDLEGEIRQALRVGESVKDLSARLARETGISKKALYDRAVAIAGEAD